jgi:hypothetical protein
VCVVVVVVVVGMCICCDKHCVGVALVFHQVGRPGKYYARPMQCSTGATVESQEGVCL